MALPPLAFGTTATPLDTLTAPDIAALLVCGPLDLGRLNALLKVLGDRIDAVDAADNAIVSASYNSTTNDLTFVMADGADVVIPIDDVIADAVATAISGATLPVGVITLWSGGVVPVGWHLCDGTAGTPDLRNKFVVGAGVTYPSGSSGGAATHDHSGATAGHALTAAELPTHRHAMFANVTNDVEVPGGSSAAVRTSNSPGEEEYKITNGGATAATLGLTGAVGGDDPHAHAIGPSGHLPPYYALAYIMKV